LKHTL